MMKFLITLRGHTLRLQVINGRSGFKIRSVSHMFLMDGWCNFELKVSQNVANSGTPCIVIFIFIICIYAHGF